MKKIVIALLFAFSAFGQRGVTQDVVVNLGPFVGMVTTRDQYNLAPNELSEAINVDFAKNGEARCRYGYDYLSTVKGGYVVGYENSYERFAGSTDNPTKYPSFVVVASDSGDTLRYYDISDGTQDTVLVHGVTTRRKGFVSIKPWMGGYLFTVPSTTAAPNDTTNSVLFRGTNSMSKAVKIGMPTCLFSVAQAAGDNGGDVLSTSGSYTYAVTFRREYTDEDGTVYYDEGTSGTATLAGTSGQYVTLSSISRLDSNWVRANDHYEGGWTRNVYKSLPDGSVLYLVGQIHNDSTSWIDTVAEGDINLSAQTYSEVSSNFCLDSLINAEWLVDADFHNNTIVALSEIRGGKGVTSASIWRTIPLTLQYGADFTSSRRAIQTARSPKYYTGLISCGEKLFGYGLGGLDQIYQYNTANFGTLSLHSLPVLGSNCVECIDNELWGLSAKGEVFSGKFGVFIDSRVALIDSSLIRLGTYANKVFSNDDYISQSFNVIRPFGTLQVFSSNTKKSAYAGTIAMLQSGVDMAWSKWDVKARAMAGSPVSNIVTWVDTSNNNLLYWPSSNLNKKDYNGSDSSLVKWSISTGWMNFGSFDGVKSLQRVSMDMGLSDTLRVYSYWDNSTAASDTGVIVANDTTYDKNVADFYNWFPDATKNVGHYLKLKFEHQNCDYSRIRFRNAKVYARIAQR